MFNATKGKQKLAEETEEETGRFAALFDDVPARKQLELITRLNKMLPDEKAVDAFIATDSTQTTTAAPVQALGPGSPSPTAPNSEQEALSFLFNSGNVPRGVKAAVRRIFAQSDPDWIKVGVDGTPEEVGQLRQEILTAKADRQKAENDLAEQGDPNKAGSLAHQLAIAKAGQRAPANMVDKTAIKSKVDALTKAVTEVEARRTKLGAEGHLKKVTAAAKDLLSDVV